MLTTGSSFFVNYRVLRDTTAGETAGECLADTSCLSFDHDGSAGWMHKVTRDCAAAAGASFKDGDSRGTTFYEKLPQFRVTINGTDPLRCGDVAAQTKEDNLNKDNGYSPSVSLIFAITGGAILGSAILGMDVYDCSNYSDQRTTI